MFLASILILYWWTASDLLFLPLLSVLNFIIHAVSVMSVHGSAAMLRTSSSVGQTKCLSSSLKYAQILPDPLPLDNFLILTNHLNCRPVLLQIRLHNAIMQL
ncbi:hypothetical protein BDR07DRAFT_644177 [Suillus spraguei]|nr:hypothetical protein BDR07DRAFT_644177 [Suillus spraguei]